ncbi:MAG: orotate phosphoribosyltransferase [Oscillospiraceae bacterium]|jgi:orotate phosphoribosyltransferase|nr:orotate phosphoribosyltransferase [Oscillospiraceae bacterium]
MSFIKNLEKEIALCLLDIGAVFLNPNEPFVWASGIKSPIYCDNRLILSFPAERNKIEKALASMVRREYPQCDFVAGTSTAGIAHAALLADLLYLPMVYVRGSSKDHGRKSKIEGTFTPNSKAVVIEDLISTASSAVEVVRVLRDSKVDVLGIASIFTYNLRKGFETLSQNHVKNVSLTNYDSLIELALDCKKISPHEFELLVKFKENPELWSKEI